MYRGKPPPPGLQLSRNLAMVHPSIHAIHRQDLEAPGTASIALEIREGGDKVVIFSLYRQWQVPGLAGSETQAAQLERFKAFLSM